MKHQIIFVICLVLLISTVTQSQFIRGYGFKVGAVSANQTYDYNIVFDFSPDNRWGFDVGAFVELLDIPYISVLGELHYIQKGFSEKFQETSPDDPAGTGRYITLKPRADYFSIPVLAKIRFELGPIVPYIIGGPRFDFLVGKEADGFEAVIDHLKSADVGISVGGGVEVKLPAGPAILGEIRYSPDFTNAFKSSTLTVKNQSVELLVGVMF
jgi:hypothetical protein